MVNIVKNRNLFFPILIVFLFPTSSFAEKGIWSFTPYGGAILATSRNMVESKAWSLNGPITLSDGSQLSGTVAADVNELSFDDTHDIPVLTGFDVGYFLSDDFEVFGGFQYIAADGKSTKAIDITAAGNFTDAAGTITAIGVTDTVNVLFDDYDSWALKVGATKYFLMSNFTPYIGGYAGYKHVDDMNVKLTLASAANVSGNIKFYDETDTGYFGIHTGINKSLILGGIPLDFGVRARLDYTPELDSNNSDTSLIAGGNETHDSDGGVDFGFTGQLSIPF
ncbi:MAG: hypothetical protein HOG97_07000 [Candidatus Marinimicrobia bacterium]|mgnify:FL=1|nr:hypothetical protein [Candidatus Neomarinimicrobiota bacterium]